MQFLSLSSRRGDRFSDAEFAALVDAEIAQARALYADGFIRQIWHRGDVPGACILLEADSLEQASERLRTLPLIRAGMLEVSIVPLVPYAGFSPRLDRQPVQAMAAPRSQPSLIDPGAPVTSRGRGDHG
jgi:muconolactone delta-isomerase